MQGNSSKQAKTDRRQDPYYQAQDILSRRDHSEAEVRQKLTRKGFSSSEVQSVIEWLYTKKLLDDKLVAERYVSSVLSYKTIGPRWLKMKLRQRGVDSETLDETISAAFAEPGREEQLLEEAATSWQRRVRHPADKERLARFLAGRGFTPDKISNYLETLT